MSENKADASEFVIAILNSLNFLPERLKIRDESVVDNWHCVLAVLTSNRGFSLSTESVQEREDSLRIDTSSDVPKVGLYFIVE